MKARTASSYRKVFREELHWKKQLSDDEVVDALYSCCEPYPGHSNSGLLYGACGLLAYGYHDKLEEALQALANDPSLSMDVPAKATITALRDFLPLPNGVTLRDPRAILDWYMAQKNQLAWDEEQGLFLLRQDTGDASSSG